MCDDQLLKFTLLSNSFEYNHSFDLCNQFESHLKKINEEERHSYFQFDECPK